MKKLLDYLDIDFYEVKSAESKKVIHDLAYFYCCDSDEKMPYRTVEFCNLELDPDELRANSIPGEATFENSYYDFRQSEVKQYITDIDDEGISEALRIYLEITAPLPMEEVTAATPIGLYRNCNY